MINRKREKKEDKNIDFGSLIDQEYQKKLIEFLKFQEIIEKKDFNSLNQEEREKFLEFLRFQYLSKKLEKKFNISGMELIKKLEQDVLIPASIFTKELGVLETICKYLKENLNLSNKKIALLVNRDSKSIWQAYNESKKKIIKKFEDLESKYLIPASIFQNKKLSLLENVVFYLKEEFSLTYHEIAVLLKRDDRTIWTVYQKARKKNVKK